MTGETEESAAPATPSYEVRGEHVVLKNLPPECDAVILGFVDHQFQPRHIRLPHQVKASDLARLSAEGHGDVAIYPAVTKGRVWIKRGEIAEIALRALQGED